MNASILLSVVLFLVPLILKGQSDEITAYEQQYAINITQEYINDVYIPEDVEDAMKQLDLLSDSQGRERLIEAEEHIAAERLVMGLGKWMIVYWNFYEGSRLSHKLKEYGVTHPDDMARFLIVSYHRYLRKVPLELEKRGKEFFEKRKKEQDIRNAEKKVIKEMVKNGN